MTIHQIHSAPNINQYMYMYVYVHLCVFLFALTGSHDSMSYDLDVNSPIIEPERVKRFSKIYCVRKIVRRWAVTQVKCVFLKIEMQFHGPV